MLKNIFSLQKPSLFGLLSSAALICFVLTAFSFLGPLWWFFDLCCHFHLQYGLYLLLFLPVLLWKKRYIFVGPVLILICINMYPVLSLYKKNNTELNAESTTNFSIMLLNVEARNSAYQETMDVIHKINPDILLLEEFTNEWLKGTAELNELFPYRFGSPQPDCSGNMLFSKFPLENELIKPSGSYARPTIFVTLNIKGKAVNIVGTHPLPPIGNERNMLRNQHLFEVADILAEADGQTVFLGDLNTTPYSEVFRNMLKTSGLLNSMQGFGPQFSWPAWKGYISPFLIPIDHCFVSHNIAVLDRRIGPYTGSDHYPLILKLGLE